MDLREATITDLDSITEIALAACSLDPQWHYRFPHRHEFPEDTENYTKIGYRAFFDAPKETSYVILATLPSLEDPTVTKPVAIAVWETNLKSEVGIPTRSSQKCQYNYFLIRDKNLRIVVNVPLVVINPPNTERRRDAHPRRMEAFTDAMEVAHRRYFSDIYGADHIHLKILATHPDYRRRGAGTKLCNWGIDLAEKNRAYISVFASPMGEKLYARLGFKELAVVVVQVKGEEEKVSISAMLYTPGRRKGSWCLVT